MCSITLTASLNYFSLKNMAHVCSQQTRPDTLSWINVGVSVVNYLKVGVTNALLLKSEMSGKNLGISG